MENFYFDAGAGTARSARFDDIYFNADALAEVGHVFLEGNDLPRRLAEGRPLAIGELGFGTGLNFLAVWDLWVRLGRPCPLEFTSLELFPLTVAELEPALAPLSDRGRLAAFLGVYRPEGGRWELEPGLTLTVEVGEASAVIARFPRGIDAWFLDGFSPAKNPAMWAPELLAAVAAHSAPGATLASFTAAGDVKTRLRSAGFHIKRRKGFGNKRHMIIGTLFAPRSP